MVKDAEKALTGQAPSTARDKATVWLDRASHAIEQRNATLHAVPVVRFEAGRLGAQEQFLGEMPRKGRAYYERPLTVESLNELRTRLEEAAAGWKDVLLALAMAARQE
jgi:hypothetical protein